MSDPRKPYFDAARKADDDGILTDDDVAKISAVLDLVGIARAPVEAAPEEMELGAEGEALIKGFEGCAKMLPDGRVAAYPDPGTGGAPWTIGWGATGADIKQGTIWTKQQADDWFDKHIKRYAADVRKAIGSAPTSQAQFDALVSFHYNTGAIGKATLTSKHKAGDFAGAEAEFARWNRAGGRVMKGLVRRRAAEARLYRSGS